MPRRRKAQRENVRICDKWFTFICTQEVKLVYCYGTIHDIYKYKLHIKTISNPRECNAVKPSEKCLNWKIIASKNKYIEIYTIKSIAIKKKSIAQSKESIAQKVNLYVQSKKKNNIYLCMEKKNCLFVIC